MLPNFYWAGEYLKQVSSTSLMGPDAVETRGAAWQFLRYAADRRGGSEQSAWRTLASPGAAGFDNLVRVFGSDVRSWIHDWMVSLYTDDAVAGVASQFQQPSWNFRDLFSGIRNPEGGHYGGYPLRTHRLTRDTTLSLSLRPWSGAHVRLGAPSGGVAQLSSLTGGARCGHGAPTVQLEVGEARTFRLDESPTICLFGGNSGADFVYVATTAHIEATLVLDAAGVSPVVPGSLTVGQVDPWQRGDARLLGTAELRLQHRAWEARFRTGEARELRSLSVREGLSGASSQLNPASISPVVTITVARTR
jgi:hypothetical protein